MKKENYTPYVILGLLTTGCSTGYSIKQMIDKSLNHFWKISYGQIYPTLKKLVKEELATVSVTSQEDRPEKKEYKITARGKQELLTWLQNPIRELTTERNEVLLKIFFSRHQEIDNSIELLDHHYSMLLNRYNILVSIEKNVSTQSNNDEDSVYWIMTLDYGLKTTKAAMEWCEETKVKLLRNKGE
ncbi:PadR family transcriptional regulator [Jeotgalibacillus campisalis]|uniref:Transcriptional regulator n=1 Tax=Jeotgalibacillus campisalis TaxID=220754 RepID=A0A0C2W383_9BACL|nr:PadR family transcriptional regulator [Jeotgalibacillus campisalis]KIL51081.1 hypothetical protein KR50_09620 [Jeotgalibacillus campisalis]